MKFDLVLACLTACAAASVPAQAAEKAAAGKCFAVHDITNHTVSTAGHTLYLNVGGKSVWQVEMTNQCLGGVGSTDPIGIKARGASDQICEPVDLDISVALGGGGLPTKCRVDSIQKLTPAAVAALPKSVKP